MRRFGTAGIRGVTNAGITPELALALARAYAAWLRSQGAPDRALGVAHDTRYGAEMLARAAASGFAAQGFDVAFFGCLATGPFSLNVARGGLAGGLLVTGSHLPPDRSGLLLVDADGAVCPFSTTDAVEQILDRDPPPEGAAPADLGRLEDAFHPYELYVAECMKSLDAPACRARKFRVAVDPANGAACLIAKEFFEWLGADVHMLHFDPNPVPDRPSEPRADTVGAAIRAVLDEKCDLGACFDVDADRVLFIDADGLPLSEDAAGAIFARSVLKPGDACVVPVNSSGLIERVCREAGARLEYCGVGQPHEVEALRRHRARFCYEESGKYYFPDHGLWADGLYSAGRLIELMATSGKSLAQLAAPFPRFHQVKRNVAVDDALKPRAMDEVARLLRSRLAEGRVRDVTLDGFKRLYADDAWLLFRQSGTEPLIRVYTDAPSAGRARELADAGEKLLRECLP
jgi:phosphomannomutase/phosphoglucomutase